MKAQFIGNTSSRFFTNKIYNIRTDCKTLNIYDKYDNVDTVTCLCIYDIDSSSWCPYQNLEAMLQNWKIIIDKIKFM